MKIKRGIQLVLILLILFSISAASAADNLAEDTISANDNGELILDESIHEDLSNANDNGELILDESIHEDLSNANDDEEPINEIDDNKIVYAENDLDELSDNPGTYSGLSSEIGTGGDIVLTHDYYTYDSGSTIEISVSNSVIDGNGAIIDMAGSTIRAFKVTGSGVTIKNLTIKNANVTTDDENNMDDEGAAIDFEKSGTVEDCNFINNSANAAGAVYFKKADSKVINCNFTENKAIYSGGAVCFEESGTIENCTFVGNSAVYDILGGGGAVCFNGTGNAINCNFTNNSAQGYFSWAGAICFNANGNAINCTFTNNKAYNSGGAIEIYGNGKIENCSFDKNSAKDGGAIEIYGSSIISNCNFTENKAEELSGDGGAIFWNASAGKLENCSFTKNSAFHGGAVSFEKDGEVTNCNFTDNFAGDGSAIWFTEEGTVENSAFLKNEAWDEYGGGICFYTTGEVRNCNFTDNTAYKQGGAVYYNGAGTVENSNFTNNKAQDGGAIFFSEDSTVENCIFVKNCATDVRQDRYFGGAIVFYKNGEVTNSSFTENNATEGGAILFKGNGKATDCNFTNNSAQYGGAIDFESRTTVENCSFNGNIASSNGSAIWLNRAGGIISSSVFVNNRANSGIIYFRNNDSTSHLTINDNIFLNNNGVAIYFDKNDSASNADYNWFGNNASNYDTAPAVTNNVEISTWLFLNATANPDPVPLIGSTDIVFKLYAYTPSEVSEYDNSRLKAVNLTLDLINGGINTTKTGLDETVKFNPMDEGTGTLTATIENAAYTIRLKITDGTTFCDLNWTINGNDNDTIVLDRDYTYNSTVDYNFNEGIVIDRPVTIIGNNHVLDATGLARIFNITADNVVIKNITFTNANTSTFGSAICWDGANGKVSDCVFENNSADTAGGAIFWDGANGKVSDCSFVNNSAILGGAIFWQDNLGVVSGSSFVNNSAVSGGAIRWNGGNGNVSDCSFVNNSAENGGAIYWQGFNSVVSGSVFVNNSAENGTIYFYNQDSGRNLTIHDNIFLKNDAVAIYFDKTDSTSNADYNWFGNNATNYNIAPTTNNVEISTWLFLNATANHNPISILGSSDIVFKLYAYNSSGVVSEYGNSPLKAVNLTLTLTNGGINTTETGLDETVKFNPMDEGTGTLTATIENAAYTIRLKITDGTTFSDLNQAINGNDNDTVVLDKDYTYNPTVDSDFTDGIVIDRAVTIIGNGHTIDAAGLARIFNIQADDVAIKNITFTNANTSTFGAIYWQGNAGVVSGCSFVNNTAENGGIIFWQGNDGLVSGCVFVNNSAENGTIHFMNSENGYEYLCRNLTINNNIFLNNYDYEIYFAKRDLRSNADFNWFGNNATDYDMAPATFNLEIETLLFLNATADPNPVEILKSSDISFKLYSYNATGISDYDNSRLQPVNLTLTATNGDVDSTAKLGETVKYNATGLGTGSVTAKIENIICSIEINNVKLDSNLSVESDEVTYGNNVVIALNYDSVATGKVNITLKGKKSNYTFEDMDLNATVSIGIVGADEYEVIVEYSGDDTYSNATASGTLNVNKANSTLTVSDIEFDYNDMGSGEISFTNATGVEAKVINHDEAIVFVSENTITVSNLSANSYILSITTITDENHSEVTKNATITVRKINSTIDVDDIVLYYGESINITVTADGAIEISAKIDGENVEVNENIITIPDDLRFGNHTLTITTVPDENHNEATKTVNIVDCRIANITLVVDDAIVDESSNINIKLVDWKGNNVSGIVKIAIGEDEYNVTVTDGKGSVSIAPFAQTGTYDVVASFNDESYAPSLVETSITVYGPGNITVKHTDAGDTADIQAAIDAANPGDVVHLGNYDYTDVADVNITKNITLAGSEGTTITSTGDGTPIFNVPAISENGPESVNITGIDFKLANGDTVVKATADNNTADPLSIVTPSIGISGNTFELVNETTVPESTTILELDSERGVLSPTGEISISANTIAAGVNPFEFEVTNVGSGDDVNIVPQNITPKKKATVIHYEDMNTTTVDQSVDGRAGKYFNFQLTDTEGNPIVGVPMQIGFLGVIYDESNGIITNETGGARLQINLGYKNDYTFAICFLGNDEYNASFVIAKIIVTPQKGSLTVPNKSYSASAKTKTLTATFKSASGKPVAGKTIKFTVNGKTYSAKTNSKGVASVNVSLNKKGTYSFTAKFTTNGMYETMTKTGKLTIK